MLPCIVYATCLAAAVPVRIAVIGDRTTGCDDPSIFPRCVLQAVLMSPDVIVSVGDIIEGGGGDQTEIRRQWSEVLGLLAPAMAAAPVFLVPGNHDIWSDESEAAWIDAAAVRPERITVICGVSFVSWDTSREETLTAKTLDHLDSLLAGVDPSAPCVLVTHRPFWCMEGEDPGSVERMRSVVEAADIEVVLGGHIHVFCSERNGGVLYVSAGPSGGAGLPIGIIGGTSQQTGWLTVFEDSASYAVLRNGAILPGDLDTGIERLMLDLVRTGSCGTGQ